LAQEITARIQTGDPIFRDLGGGEVLTDWGVNIVMAPSVWKSTRGKGAKVAVLDTGVDLNHPDLAGRVAAYRNFTSPDPDDVHDAQGHGTHTAGIVAGNNNGAGVVGVAPEADLYIAKVLDDDGGGGLSVITEGIRWAIAQGVDIISMSLGCEEQPPDAFHQAIQDAVFAGITVVVAAGNEGHALDWPAAYPETISVGALDETFSTAEFSNFGNTLDVIAPGVDIFSTWPGGRYAILSGTSMATPMVAGCIALLLAHAKDIGRRLTPPQVVDAIRKTSILLNADNATDYQGAGLINCAKLISL
jgi:subtilisin family serine protease